MSLPSTADVPAIDPHPHGTDFKLLLGALERPLAEALCLDQERNRFLKTNRVPATFFSFFQSAELAACLLRVRHIGHGVSDRVSDRQHATTLTSYSCLALPLRVDRLRLRIVLVVAARGPRPNCGISMCNAAKV